MLTAFFIQGVYSNYRDGLTNFAISQVPLTIYEDYPTITICFESSRDLEIERDFTINQQYGQNLDWDDSNLERDVPMTRKIKVADVGETKKNCFMIKRTKNDILGGVKYIQFRIRFRQQPEFLQAPLVYFTTEANAYGVVGGRWLDGQVQCCAIKVGFKLHNGFQ